MESTDFCKVDGAELMEKDLDKVIAARFRFGIYVDGEGPYGAASVSELKVEMVDVAEYMVEPVTIRAAIYKSNEKKDTLFNAIVKKTIDEIENNGKSEPFDIRLDSYGRDGDEVVTVVSWNLLGCQLVRYTLDRHDASFPGLIPEAIVILPKKITCDYE